MNSIDLSKLRGPGKVIIGLNNSYPKVYPDIWISADDPHCYNRHVFFEPFMKILRGGYNKRNVEGRSIHDLHNTYFYPHDECFYIDLLKKVGKNTKKFVWHWDVFTLSINIILWMGFKEIYLVGCDLSCERGDYHHNEKLTENQRAYNEDLYQKLYGYLSWLKKQQEKLNMKVFSMSPLSRINDLYPFISIEELNCTIATELPPLGPLNHTVAVDGPRKK